MNAEGLTVRQPRPQDQAELFDLAGKCFSGGGYFEMRTRCRGGYIAGSHYDWDTSRIGLLDGRIVAHFGVWDYRMRIGSGRVRVAGVGLVMTHAETRRRGFMLRTGRAAIGGMRAGGYDMSVLFGIHGFYNRFGYVRAWNASTWTARVADLPKDPPAPAIRKFSPNRCCGEIDALYNRTSAALTGTAVRPTYSRRQMSGYVGYCWRGPAGRLAGYVIVKPGHETLTCVDFGGAAGQVLRVLGRLGRRWNCRDVVFETLHYDHALCRRLRRGTCTRRERYVRSGRAMVRTICLASTLRKMAGELSRRLKRSHLAGWRGELLIADPREKVALRINRGKVAPAPATGRKYPHAVRGGEQIAQPLIGIDEPDEIVAGARIRLTGQARKLTGVLFPDQHPMLAGLDHF